MPKKNPVAVVVEEECKDECISLVLLHKLMDQQKASYKDLIEQQERSYRAFMQMILDSTNKRVDELMKEVQELRSSLQFSQNEVDELKQANNTSIIAFRTVSDEFALFKETQANLSDKSDYLDNQSRRNNILIDGIPDVITETWHESECKVKKILAEHLKMDPKLIEMERAHRTGKYLANGRPRSVVVKLLRFKDKTEILRQAKQLKGTNLFINEDYSEKVRQKRKELLPELRAARKQGNIAYLKYDQLIVHPASHPRTTTSPRIDA